MCVCVCPSICIRPSINLKSLGFACITYPVPVSPSDWWCFLRVITWMNLRNHTLFPTSQLKTQFVVIRKILSKWKLQVVWTTAIASQSGRKINKCGINSKRYHQGQLARCKRCVCVCVCEQPEFLVLLTMCVIIPKRRFKPDLDFYVI